MRAYAVGPVKSMLPDRARLVLAVSLASLLSQLGGCGDSAKPAPTQAAETASKEEPKKDEPKKDDPKKDDVKVAKENWPNGKLKFYNELRRNPDGKWARNGIGRAYYDHGVLEREGMYRNDVRVGEWKYFDQDGKLLRVEQRGDGTGTG